MKTKCVVNSETKIVENVIVLNDNDQWSTPEGFEIPNKENGSIGDFWDGENFRPLKPYESWVWDSTLIAWVAPIEKPNDGKNYYWVESLMNWKIVS